MIWRFSKPRYVLTARRHQKLNRPSLAPVLLLATSPVLGAIVLTTHPRQHTVRASNGFGPHSSTPTALPQSLILPARLTMQSTHRLQEHGRSSEIKRLS